MSVTPYVPPEGYELDEATHERVLELADEDPVRFIDMDEPDTALGLIRGIDDLERLTGWRLANQSFFDPPKRTITKALDARERELRGEPTPEPEPVVDPEPTTDDEPGDESAEPETPDVHPDSNLEFGEVLVVTRGDKREYVTPNAADADEPYCSQTVDEEGDLWTETDLGVDEVASRLRLEHERTTLEKIDAPAEVAR